MSTLEIQWREFKANLLKEQLTCEQKGIFLKVEDLPQFKFAKELLREREWKL